MTFIKKKLVFVCLTAAALLAATAVPSLASHFRYGVFSWHTPNQGAPRTVQFDLQLAFRSSYFTTNLGITPTAGALISGANAGGAGGLTINPGDPANPGLTIPIYLRVTSVDTTNDWFIATAQTSTGGAITYTYPNAGTYTAFHTNSNRLSAPPSGPLHNNGDTPWRVETRVVIPSSGVVNQPPTTSLPPIVTVKSGASNTFFVPATDPEGNPLTFSLASAAQLGQAGETQPTGFTVNSSTGLATFNTGALALGLWNAQIVVSDGTRYATVDFLLNIANFTTAPPTCTVNGQTTAQTFNVKTGSPVSFPVTATAAGGGVVTLQVSGLPSGATMNPSLPYSATSPATSTFSWTPTLADGGAHVISFSCTDNVGQQNLNSATVNVNLPVASTLKMASPQTMTYGGPLTLTARLSTATGFVSGETVSFKVNGNTVGSDATDANGVATLTIPNATIGNPATGTYALAVDAAFAGDSDYLASSTTADLRVDPAATTTVLTSSPNPSSYLDPVTFTATVTSGAGTPGGGVTFKEGATTLGTGTLDGAGVAAFTTATLSGGTHHISAFYDGSQNFGGSNSDPLDQVVSPLSTQVAITCPASVQYDGSAQEPCTATVTGPGNFSEAVGVSYADNTNAGQATASASFAGNDNYEASGSSTTFTIGRAESTTVVTCSPGPHIYDGTPQIPCSAAVTGAGGLDQPLVVTYANNLNAGTATAMASYPGDPNHQSSTGMTLFAILRAPVTATAGGGSSLYDGASKSPAACSVSGPFTGALTCVNSPAIVGPQAGNFTILPGVNYNGAEPNNFSVTSAVGHYVIGPAPSTVVVTCPVSVSYTGQPQSPCSAAATGAGDLNETLEVSYTDNTNAGTAHANASYGGDVNHTGNTGAADFTIAKASTQVTVTVGDATYDGTPHGGSANVTGPANLNDPLPVKYVGRNGTIYGPSNTPPTNAGEYTAQAREPESANYATSNASADFVIHRAPVTATAGGGSALFDGNTKSPSACVVTGLYTGGLTCANNPASVGPGPGTTTIVPVTGGAGIENFDVTPVDGSFTIGKNTSTVTVTCPVSVPYSGLAQTPCLATVTGAGGLSQSLAVSYGNNTHVGNATASATFAGDAMHDGSTGSSGFAIARVALTVKANDKSKTLNAANPTFDVSYTGFVGPDGPSSLGGSLVVTFAGPGYAASTTPPQGAGVYSITPSGLTSGDYTIAFQPGMYKILYALGTCLGDTGHGILQPINPDGSSVFKAGNTTPAKFRVCDANGVSVSTPVVQSFSLIGVTGASGAVNEAVQSTTPDTTFRWSPTDQFWIFNIGTSGLGANKKYTYQIVLLDGSTIDFAFSLK